MEFTMRVLKKFYITENFVDIVIDDFSRSTTIRVCINVNADRNDDGDK